MAQGIFNRFDICEAWYVILCEYHEGGVLRGRERTGVQLERMEFRPGPSVRERGYGGLSENGKRLYHTFVDRTMGEYLEEE